MYGTASPTPFPQSYGTNPQGHTQTIAPFPFHIRRLQPTPKKSKERPRHTGVDVMRKHAINFYRVIAKFSFKLRTACLASTRQEQGFGGQGPRTWEVGSNCVNVFVISPLPVFCWPAVCISQPLHVQADSKTCPGSGKSMLRQF